MTFKLCPTCPDKRYYTADTNYCNNCGSALIKEEEPVVEKLPIPEMTALILKTIKNIRDTEVEEDRKRKEVRTTLLAEDHSYVRHTISSDGINIVRITGDDQAEVVVYEDSLKGGETIIKYYVEPGSALSELWDDLTDIMALGIHPKTKAKYFKQFSVRDKPYKQQVTVIYEGGDLYVK
jgi:hypothetical protein